MNPMKKSTDGSDVVRRAGRSGRAGRGRQGARSRRGRRGVRGYEYDPDYRCTLPEPNPTVSEKYVRPVRQMSK